MKGASVHIRGFAKTLARIVVAHHSVDPRQGSEDASLSEGSQGKLNARDRRIRILMDRTLRGL